LPRSLPTLGSSLRHSVLNRQYRRRLPLPIITGSCTLDRPMKRSFNHRLAVILCVIGCVAAAMASPWSHAGFIRTEDQNGDGRPDIWRTYDVQGRLAEVAVDTNFDGRSDVREYYERSALIRRESDRDFNGRVDLVQEFEPNTHEPLRSVVDVDFDGTADLLVLFQDGRPVFSRRAQHIAAAGPAGSSGARAAPLPRTADDQLAAFDDPFRIEFSLRAVRNPVGSGDWVGLSTSGGLPSSCTDATGPITSPSPLSGSSAYCPSSANVLPHSPRGPPASPLLT
jgi:hypothetical protein